MNTGMTAVHLRMVEDIRRLKPIYSFKFPYWKDFIMSCKLCYEYETPFIYCTEKFILCLFMLFLFH